jgi:ribonuclease D
VSDSQKGRARKRRRGRKVEDIHQSDPTEDVLVQDDKALQRLCAHLRHAPRIALDTEFIPEKTFTPELCLVQVATEEVRAVVDALAFEDLTPLWEAICRRGCEVVVHAGRAEMDFCLDGAGRLPGRVIDVQLLAGFVGLGYPISHTKLVREVMDLRTESSQTRTDWRRRPLTEAQIRYAVEDVEHLLEIRDRLMRRCREMRRLEWFSEESQRFLELLQGDGDPLWKRTSGSGSLKGRELAVLHHLTLWREERAQRLNKPRKRILADDYLVELARVQPTAHKHMERSRRLAHLGRARWLDDIFDAVERGLAMPEQDWPSRKKKSPHAVQRGDLLLKILTAVVAQIAEDRLLAPTLLGTRDDISQLIEWHRAGSPGDPPRLMRGWRARICGRPLLEVMEGRLLVGVEPHGQQSRLFLAPDPDMSQEQRDKMNLGDINP